MTNSMTNQIKANPEMNDGTERNNGTEINLNERANISSYHR
jgi:hypothetical protein